MADPLSIAAAVVALIGRCATTAKALHGLISQYNNAQLTISSMCVEIAITSASLSQIQSIILHAPASLESRLDARQDLKATFDTALTGSVVIFSVLEAEIMKVVPDVMLPTAIGKRAKIRAVWNEDVMSQLLSSLSRQQVAITLLLQTLQVQSASEIRALLTENSAILKRIAGDTKQLRARNPGVDTPESIYTESLLGRDHSAKSGYAASDRDFIFDDEVINSRVYRQVVAKYRSTMTLLPYRAEGMNDSQEATGTEITSEAHSITTAEEVDSGSSGTRKFDYESELAVETPDLSAPNASAILVQPKVELDLVPGIDATHGGSHKLDSESISAVPNQVNPQSDSDTLLAVTASISRGFESSELDSATVSTSSPGRSCELDAFALWMAEWNCWDTFSITAQEALGSKITPSLTENRIERMPARDDQPAAIENAGLLGRNSSLTNVVSVPNTISASESAEQSSLPNLFAYLLAGLLGASEIVKPLTTTENTTAGTILAAQPPCAPVEVPKQIQQVSDSSQPLTQMWTRQSNGDLARITHTQLQRPRVLSTKSRQRNIASFFDRWKKTDVIMVDHERRFMGLEDT